MIPQLGVAQNFRMSRYADSGGYLVDEWGSNDLQISSAPTPMISDGGFLRAQTRLTSTFGSASPSGGPFSFENGFSWAAWTCLETSTGGDYGYPFSFGAIGNAGWTAVSWGYGGVVQPFFFASFNSGASYQQVIAADQSSTIVIGNLDHWLFTMRPDGSSTYIKMYRNGLEIGSGTMTGTLDTYSTQTLTVGGYGGGGYPSYFDMKDIHFYNAALSPEEAIELHTLGPTQGWAPMPRYRGLQESGGGGGGSDDNLRLPFRLDMFQLGGVFHG